MKKYILTTILILSFLFIPSMMHADLPIFEDDGGTGDGGGYTGGGNTGSSGNTGTPSGFTSSGTSIKSDLFVETNDADFITYTTARLHGRGGDKFSNRTLPITAYFRYSKSPISPIFCNDIYGSNMVSTKDIPLGITASETFYQNIKNLTPDTLYYYCAIVSNKENIAYGGSSIVKEFRTSPNKTTIKSSPVTNIKSKSATLNGSYSAVENVTTYFQYKISGTTGLSEWKDVCKKEQIKPKGNANIYGTISCDISELEAYTRYQFRTVAKNVSGSGENKEEKIFYGATLNFLTNPLINDAESTDTGGKTGGNTGGGKKINNTKNTNTNTGRSTNTTTNINTTNNNNSGRNTNNTNNRNTNGTGTNDGGWNTGNNTNNTGTNNVGWNTGNGNNTNGYQIINNIGNSTLKLGQKINPPNDAIVRYREGIEHVFVRQIIGDIEFAKIYGYTEGQDLQKFAWYLADEFARAFGYVNQNRKEIRVSLPDIAAYQLSLLGNKLTVYEYYDNVIVDIRNTTTTFKEASEYEYYFKK